MFFVRSCKCANLIAETITLTEKAYHINWYAFSIGTAIKAIENVSRSDHCATSCLYGNEIKKTDGGTCEDSRALERVLTERRLLPPMFWNPVFVKISGSRFS